VPARSSRGLPCAWGALSPGALAGGDQEHGVVRRAIVDAALEAVGGQAEQLGRR
jgi:hypothetical protein